MTDSDPRSSPTDPLDTDALVAIAEGIASGNPGAFVPPGTARRWALVAATERYAAWVIAWPAGTGLAMHDHDGSSAMVRVVSGRLRERYHAESGLRTRWLSPGDRHLLAADHVHEVINLGADEAVTVHVYSPPLADMTFRVDPEIDLRSDPAEGWPSVPDPRRDHPAFSDGP